MDLRGVGQVAGAGLGHDHRGRPEPPRGLQRAGPRHQVPAIVDTVYLKYSEILIIRLNKFPTTNPLCRKDLMWNNFKAMQKKFGKRYFAFMPETFNYPAEGRQLKGRIKKYNNTALWICKPPRGSQGNGIILARTLKDRASNEGLRRFHNHREGPY